MRYKEKVVIIGAGISGLACAFRLKQLGIQCLVLEAGERPGGVITTIRRNGYLFDLGPQCPRFPSPAMKLLRDLQLEQEFVPGDPKAKRYIFRHGKLHPAPFSPVGIMSTRLIGASSKWHFLTEAFRSTRPPAQEETLAEFVERKFGADVLENVVDPVIATIFFGDAHKMGMESAFPDLVEWERDLGSLMRGAFRARNAKREAAKADTAKASIPASANGNSMALPEVLPSSGSFQSGMGRLPEKLAEELNGEIRYNVRMAGVQPNRDASGRPQAGWQIQLANGESLDAEQLILAVPAFVAGEFLGSTGPRLASQLKAIEYAPMFGVSSAYDRSDVPKIVDGFGFMIPRREGLRTISTFWNSSLFPHRAPEGKVLMTSFAEFGTGGDSKAMSEEECARAVEAENARILGITGEPVDREIWTNRQAMPQYNVGHARRVAAINELLRNFPALHLAGNYLKGRSIGECVELAFKVAEEVHSRLPQPNI